MKIVLSAGGTLVCDFCGESNPVWDYPCRDYEVFNFVCESGKTLDVGSLGHWTACESCHELIETGERDELAARSVVTMVEMGKVAFWDAETWHQRLRTIQDTFWWNRTGSAIYMGEK